MKRTAAVIMLAAVLIGCGTIQPGADPIVVNAERVTASAVDTFDTFLKYEHNNRAALDSINPGIHKYANVLRRNGQKWLQTARAETQAYKYNRSETNKANLQTAIAVLQEAVNQVGQYMSQAKPQTGVTRPNRIILVYRGPPVISNSI